MSKEQKFNYYILGLLTGIGIGFWGLVLLEQLLK